MAETKKPDPRKKRATTRSTKSGAKKATGKGTANVRKKAAPKAANAPAKPAASAKTRAPAKPKARPAAKSARSAGAKSAKPDRSAKTASGGTSRRDSARAPFRSRTSKNEFGTAGTQPDTGQDGAAVRGSRVNELGDSFDIRDLRDKLWRLLAMIAFSIIGFWVYLGIAILAAMQFVMVLLSDRPSREVQHLMDLGAAYIAQVIKLLSYRSEDLPYPLGPPPELDS